MSKQEDVRELLLSELENSVKKLRELTLHEHNLDAIPVKEIEIFARSYALIVGNGDHK